MSSKTRTGLALMAMVVTLLALSPAWGGVSVDPSGRYYRDAAGNPKFLMGYYGWAGIPDGYYIDHPAQYSAMMTQGAPYKINYIRMSLQGNRLTASTDPPSWNGVATPVSVLYVNGKADLDQWDPVFWNGLHAQCALAQSLGIIVHLCFFDGVSTRPGPGWGYSNSYWNPANQVRGFYTNPDFNQNGGIDDGGEFYQVNAFNSNTGIGYYQRRMIDKAIAETSTYNNVMFEIGNELGASDSAWNTAVINYVRAHTDKPITQCGGGDANPMGWSTHDWAYVSDFKNNMSSIVGRGYPAWEDTDNGAFPDSNSWPNAAYDTACRQSAWYAFVGGAAGYGGFTVDFWDWWGVQRGFATTTANYYKHLQDFITAAGVQFWNMTPQQSLVSNNSVNACLAQSGTEYLAYVLNDPTVSINLGGANGTAYYQTYDPATGVLSAQQTVSAGGTVPFAKPAGASDWAVHVTATPSASWDSLGTTQTIGSGTMPCVATDKLGNIHLIYLSGSGIQYKEYNSSMSLLVSEFITSPSGGAYWPHIMCDSNNVPHVAFTESVDPNGPYAVHCYYTNRIGGTWKTPISALDCNGQNVWYPRLALWNGYAYIGCQYGYNEQSVGIILRVANLSGTPATDLSVVTATRSSIAITSAGQIYALGRYGAAGTYCQQYDSNLNPVGSLQPTMAVYPGGSQTAWTDQNNVVHMAGWGVIANGSFPCNDRCGMTYNNSSRRNQDGTYQSCIEGLLGGSAGTGPEGGEPSGFWNDDVAPVIVSDALGTVYVGYRGWNSTGEGRVSKVDASGFAGTCAPNPTCSGSNICNGTQFCTSITRRRWWNCEMAPAQFRGVYVVWDNAGTVYLRPVGLTNGDTTPMCYSDTFTYPAGSLNGIGGWYGTADASKIDVVNSMIRVTGGAGSFDAIHPMYCQGNGQGCITVNLKAFAGIGAQTMWSVWLDDPTGLNLARWYGTAATARGRIGDSANVTNEMTLLTGWNTLQVKIFPATHMSTFYLNGTSIGTLNYSPTGAGPILGRVRIERMDNAGATGNSLYFDDLSTDATAPGQVTDFLAGTGNAQTSLSWTNPTDTDFAGTMIRYKTTGFPTDQNDGTQCYNGTGTSYVHTGLTNDTVYYYSAFTYDTVLNYSNGTSVSATPEAGACFLENFAYSNGSLNGNNGWSGSAASSQIAIAGECIKMFGGAGSYDAIHTVNCGDPGSGYITVTVNINGETGANNMWNLWIDDAQAKNLARWYGAGTTARGRIGNTGSVTAAQTLTGGWDTLKVKIYPATNNTEFFFNGVSLGTLSHASEGAGDSIGRLRFERVDSTTGDNLFFDALLIGAAGADVTPPGNVTGFTATSGDMQNSLAWTNPTDGDFAGTKVMFKTTGYPTGPTDGTQCYSGTATSYLHTALTNGTTYYYKAFAFDGVPNYASGTQASAVPADVTAPANVTAFTATAGNTQNSLAWTKPGDADLAGVKIMFKTTGYPTGPADGTQCYSGLGTSYIHTGLTNGTTYYYKAFAFDEVPNYSSGAQASATPIDTTPPGNVTAFTATSGDMQNSLAWTKPGDSDLAGVKIMFKTTGYPTSQTDGTQCYNANGTSYVHTGLTNGTTYYYKAFAYDTSNNYASGTQISAVPADTVAPSNVTAFTVTAYDSQNSLSWTKPGDSDLAGVKIMFKTTGYPTGPNDGTQCYSGTGTSYLHGNLQNGTTYYYKAFAFDEVPNYSSGVQGTGAPTYSFRDQFSYSNGALNGNGGWSGSATSGNIEIFNSCVRINGGAVSKDAIKTVSIGAPSTGVIWVRCKINGEVGADTIWSLWINNSSGKNFARWYGAGTTCRGRIGNTGSVTATQTLSGAWQDMDVKITPTVQTAEFFFNGVSLGSLSFSSENPGSTVQQLRFERMDNSYGNGENLFFDDLRVGGS